MMIYFCADDYGMSKESNSRIEECMKNGVLNKISVLPNGELTDFKQHLSCDNVKISLHINLVEGCSLSDPKDVNLIASDEGVFKYSFIGLFLLSLSSKRKELEKQLYREIQNQIVFWKNQIGEVTSLSIDSHQHTHMIPLIYKTLMRVIEDEGLNVDFIRIPAEPFSPYVFTPSLYKTYSVSGLAKQWILKTLALFNKLVHGKPKIKTAYFMGAMFSGKLTEERIKKLLPRYLKLAKKRDMDIEIALHPGYVMVDEQLIDGSRTSFDKFYYSPWRKKEYDTLINFKF